MTKKTLKIEKFDGGLNSNADPRDIEDNELAAATDIDVDQGGKIRVIGQTQESDAGTKAASPPTVVINP